MAKRQRTEKPRKTDQRKTPGLEWGPQGKQTALLAGQFTEGRPRGRRKHIERGARIEPFFSLPTLQVGLASGLKHVFSFACQIKLSCNRAVTLVHGFSFTAVRQNGGNYTLPRHVDSPCLFANTHLHSHWVVLILFDPKKTLKHIFFSTTFFLSLLSRMLIVFL